MSKLLLLLAFTVFTSFAFAKEIAITILHTNDIHGHAWAFKGEDGKLRGGYAAQAELVDKIRKENEAKGVVTLLLSAGDVNTGVPESDFLSAEPDFYAMNQMHYDAMALGNHEFDGGIEKIRKQIQWSHFPVLNANVVFEKNQAVVFTPFSILEKKGIKFGILGLVTGELPALVVARHLAGLKVKDPVTTAKENIPLLKKEGAQFLIALTHVGVLDPGSRHKGAAGTDQEIASVLSDFPIIVGGHSHTLLPDGIQVNQSLIVQAGEYGKYLGRIDVSWDPDSQRVIHSKASVLPIEPEKGERKNISEKLAEFWKKGGDFLNEQVGSTLVNLDGDRDKVRHQETNLGNLICDVLRQGTRSDIAVFNGGGIRSSILKGPIRRRDVYQAFPFKNTVVTGTLTGIQLRALLQEGLKGQFLGGSFLQVSGITFNVNLEGPVDIHVKGKTLDDKRLYKVATNNFVADGGDHLETLTKLGSKKDTLVSVDDFFVKYLRKHPPIKLLTEGRIRLSK